ncbi:hypothetical protein GYMLUDRAFT_77383 [Collybiopsis luxurians FD-317 M1]|uniref:Uncharacterized protein n=1 Tax=Collybiopsis luxurians FD-317 M1 TaxID=944289 RepID=A0A0D0ATF7_9AGAR|nr:hypothetical protein GYMLUDRAFT_77383 [Collybiopsis luxurians FD-317 M1]
MTALKSGPLNHPDPAMAQKDASEGEYTIINQIPHDEKKPLPLTSPPEIEIEVEPSESDCHSVFTEDTPSDLTALSATTHDDENHKNRDRVDVAPTLAQSREWLRKHSVLQLVIPLLLAVAASFYLYHWNTVSGVQLDFPALASIHNHRVDLLFNQTVLASALSIKITEVETVTGDLAIAVAGSSLPNRQSLEKDLESFKAKLEITAEHLQDFEGKVTTALSDMVATLEGASYSITKASKSSWYTFPRHSTAHQRLATEYQEALRISSEALRTVFIQAQTLNRELKHLKEESRTTRRKVARESAILDDEKASLGGLWVALGFHSKFLENYPKNRVLLDNVDRYLSEAYNVTVAVISTLGSLKGDIEALRAKSTAIDLQPAAPLEEQLKSIQQTLTRFRISKSRHLLGGYDHERVLGIEHDYQPAEITRA